MKKYLIAACSALLLFASCAQEFNNVYKSNDYLYKYEYAKEAFANGKYNKAITILQSIVTQQKGTKDAEDCLYMLAMSEYMIRDYATASEYFKKYYQSYPKGAYAEQAEFYVGESLYMSTPEPRLDQTPTYSAIAAYQEYLDLYPDGSLKEKAQSRLFELQDKLVEKEYLSAKLYYDLGDYFGNCTNGGNNYQACVVTAQNAVNDYPYSSKREEFYILIMKSKYELARMSVESKQLERYQDAEDECYGFINEFPDSRERATAEKYIEKCKEYIAANSSDAVY
ncbi:MAG TPA: outer membrane protein assembly factor BamD [Candidatus Prevotella avicola]|uniref:Outer membrane protein assembly factor BamD n=1 Tax=Candidatus Prevotella avicola TaxID=2838738 RepID=A0A9D2JWV7_9BACT|nr:outer membrane protein assembly factor BamD [Candidatus Prevotella avicola]